ncbi:Ras and Rab interactor 1 [Varanus komodoensis]|uniref:ras and Rab interactor 1 n=1 Tax=Varanus komodoensis TaxID=61221 RepID=UPI001CF774BC|nr:ras and Rab interactor 1 [Varanus komodoensis]KAF7238528.1 Ras and Rab interactor 1 [Varanus komodoensis]
MTRNPVYDYPEPYANPRHGAVASPRKVSLVGRLRLTQPVWLQFGINSATALHILQREPAGTFLVRRSNTRQCQVLCLRLPDDSSPAFVTTYCLHQGRTGVSLDGSELLFPSLLHLIASYCSSPDVLPLSLRLPRPIWEASSCQQLEAIAHLGLEFWNSSLNTKESAGPPVTPSRMATDPLPHPVRDPRPHSSSEEAGGRPTPTPGVPGPPPEGTTRGDMGIRRQHFKNNIKVQVSTEAVSPLSPPAAPPPPIPVGKKKQTEYLPQSPVSVGRGQSSEESPVRDVSLPGAAGLESCREPRSADTEPVGHSEAPETPLSTLGQLLRVLEEEQPRVYAHSGHFLWDIQAQEGGDVDGGIRDCGLSSFHPS